MSARASLRAMLFIPGIAEEKLAKIPDLASGAFILDLEDSVPASEKTRGRQLVADLIDSIGGRYQLHVRINATTSPYFEDDLVAVVRPGLSGIVVPKAESPNDLKAVNALIDTCAADAGFDARAIEVTATIETALGLHMVHDIASAGGHLARLSFGSADFALDLGLDWPFEESASETVLFAKSQLVVASRVAGLTPPHDGAYSSYRDTEGLEREARQSRRLGFSGKHVIHPSQIPVVEEIFRPRPEQIERAQRLITAFEEAEASGAGAVGVDGELVDYPILFRARKLLEESQE